MNEQEMGQREQMYLSQMKENFSHWKVNPYAWYSNLRQHVSREAIGEKFLPTDFTIGFCTTHHFFKRNNSTGDLETIYTMLIEVNKLSRDEQWLYGSEDNILGYDQYHLFFALDITMVDLVENKTTVRRGIFKRNELARYHVIDCALTDNIGMIYNHSDELTVQRQFGR